MTVTLEFTATELTPARDPVLANQGIPAGTALPPSIEAIFTAAMELLDELATPRGVLLELSRADFEALYVGEGRNEASTPVGDILDRVDDVALFAVTVGPRVSREIETRFASNDYALGSMLDSAASAAADQLAGVAERRYRDELSRMGSVKPGTGVLRYSPGYCGWHISGQKKLFEALRPESIGISLNDSFLMQPLKSVSGAVLAGPSEMHDISMSYPACGECKTQGCQARIRALRAG